MGSGDTDSEICAHKASSSPLSYLWPQFFYLLSLRQTMSLTLNCGVEEGMVENRKRNKLSGLELGRGGSEKQGKNPRL